MALFIAQTQLPQFPAAHQLLQNEIELEWHPCSDCSISPGSCLSVTSATWRCSDRFARTRSVSAYVVCDHAWCKSLSALSPRPCCCILFLFMLTGTSHQVAEQAVMSAFLPLLAGAGRQLNAVKLTKAPAVVCPPYAPCPDCPPCPLCPLCKCDAGKFAKLHPKDRRTAVTVSHGRSGESGVSEGIFPLVSARCGGMPQQAQASALYVKKRLWLVLHTTAKSPHACRVMSTSP